MTARGKRRAPGGARRGGRPGIPPLQASRVRGLIEKLLATSYAGRGGLTRLARDIGRSQPALTQIRKGGGVDPDTAAAIARIANVDARDFVGRAYEEEPLTAFLRFSNLEVCVAYHRDRWRPWTVAAARSGLFDDDPHPERWVPRLDAIERALADVRKNSDNGHD